MVFNIAMKAAWRRVDAWLFRAELMVCLALLAGMTGAVFVDVVHRQASTMGPMERLLGSDIAASAVNGVAWFLVCALAVWTRKNPADNTPSVFRKGALVAVFGIGGLAAVKSVVWLFPHGLVWSQTFGLCGMLWCAFLGASMATHHRAHLVLEVVDFAWSDRAKPVVARVGSSFAAVFCGMMAWLSFLQVKHQYVTWVESEHVSGMFESFIVPKWIVYSILPVTFTTMGGRFLAATLGWSPAVSADGSAPAIAGSPPSKRKAEAGS